MNLSAPFIARPIATLLLAAAVLLAGLLGYRSLLVSSLPEVDFPTIQVTTELPGAGPKTVAALITAPLELQFGQIAGLDAMSSVSSEGISVITLRFSWARNIDSAALDVQAAINAAGGSLPANLPYPPVYAKVNPADAPILTLALTSSRLPLRVVADAADTLLTTRLSQIPGVGKIDIEGGLKRAVRLLIDPARLAAYGLSLEDVRNAIAAANQNGPKGGFDGPSRAVSLGANDQLVSAAAYRSLIIAWRSGAPVRLADVGSVANGLQNALVASSWQGKPAVIVDIRRQPGANIVATTALVKAALPSLIAALPHGILVHVVADRTVTIRASVADVQLTLVLSVLLVVAVIFLFLGSVRAMLIPAAALPLSLIGTFGIMAELGFGLDNLSLMALAVATGFVVDDAIVVIENIVRLIEDGEKPLKAAFAGAKQIGFTIVSLIASLISVFIPLLFMGGVVGCLFREFAITLSVAVLISAGVSLTLTPMMCGRLLEPREKKHGSWLLWKSEAVFRGLSALYAQSLSWTLHRQHAFLLLAVLTLLGTVVLYLAVPKGFLPIEDTGEVIAVTEAAPDTSIAAMSRIEDQVAAIAMADSAVSDVISLVGVGTINPTPNVDRMTIVLKPIGSRPPLRVVMRRLQAAMNTVPGMTVFLQPIQDITIASRFSRAQYQYTLTDTDAAELAYWAPLLLARLQAMPQLRHVASDQQDGGFGITVDVDRAAATRLGVTMRLVEDTLYDAFGQRQISTIFGQSN